MKKTALVALAAALLAAIPLAALGQEEPAPSPEPRTQENLVTLKLLRLTQALELTEEQTTKIYPIITRLEKEKHAILKDLNVEMRSLRDLVRTEKPDEQKILASVDKVRAMRQTVRQKDEELDQFLKKSLTVTQYAKYTLFLVDFNRRLSETLDRARTYRDQFMKKRRFN
jgi:Spy/CpxP family protein refolding chaperone